MTSIKFNFNSFIVRIMVGISHTLYYDHSLRVSFISNWIYLFHYKGNLGNKCGAKSFLIRGETPWPWDKWLLKLKP